MSDINIEAFLRGFIQKTASLSAKDLAVAAAFGAPAAIAMKTHNLPAEMEAQYNELKSQGENIDPKMIPTLEYLQEVLGKDQEEVDSRPLHPYQQRLIHPEGHKPSLGQKLLMGAVPTAAVLSGGGLGALLADQSGGNPWVGGLVGGAATGLSMLPAALQISGNREEFAKKKQGILERGGTDRELLRRIMSAGTSTDKMPLHKGLLAGFSPAIGALAGGWTGSVVR